MATAKTERKENCSTINIPGVTLQPDVDWIDLRFVMMLVFTFQLFSFLSVFVVPVVVAFRRRIRYLMILQFNLLIVEENWGTCNDCEMSQKVGAPSDQVSTY